MVTDIWELKEGDPNMRRITTFTLDPKQSLINYIMQSIKGDYCWWNYPKEIKGIRESDTVSDHFYFDDFDNKRVLAAYPRR